jgi:hypothetical protein
MRDSCGDTPCALTKARGVEARHVRLSVPDFLDVVVARRDARELQARCIRRPAEVGGQGGDGRGNRHGRVPPAERVAEQRRPLGHLSTRKGAGP